MHAIIRLHRWFKDLRTGYHVSVYDCELGTWIRADCIGGDRFLVRHNNWELRTTTDTGYAACLEAEAWFKTLRDIQMNTRDVCAEMRALCSACGGTGDVHSFDGEWRGSCDCEASAWSREGAQ